MSVRQHGEDDRKQKQSGEKNELHRHSLLGEEAEQEVGDKLKQSDAQKSDCNHIHTPTKDTVQCDGQQKREEIEKHEKLLPYELQIRAAHSTS